MNRQLSKLEQSPATAPKTWCAEIVIPEIVKFVVRSLPGNGAKGLGALKRESHFVTIPHN